MGKWVRRALQETNDTPTSTFVLQNKSRKGMEGGRLRAQNLLIRHLTLEEYEEVCRDISKSISRYTASHAMPNHSNAKRTPHIDSQGTYCKGTD